MGECGDVVDVGGGVSWCLALALVHMMVVVE